HLSGIQCFGDANTNSCSYADAYHHSYSDSDPKSYSYTHANAKPHTDAYADRYSDSNANPNSYRHSYSDTHSDPSIGGCYAIYLTKRRYVFEKSYGARFLQHLGSDYSLHN